MADSGDGTGNELVSARLKLLREALGVSTQAKMADELGVEFNRYNNVERGKPLGHELAVLICRRFPGVTLDWLYFGKADGLPLELARRLGEAARPITTPSRRAGRR